jgi:hypothetical protein
MFAVLFLLGVIYLFMGLTAYSHTIRDDRTNKILAISPWWAVYSSIYDDFGQKLSQYGKSILVIEAAGFIIWMLLR